MKKVFRVAVCLLLLAGAASAQQTIQGGELTLNQAVKVALENNVAVRQAANNLERERMGVKAAFGAYLPTVSANANWGGSRSTEYPDDTVMVSRNLRTSLSMGYTFFDGFRNIAENKSASANYDATLNTFERAKQTVVTQAQKLYYDVLRTSRLLDVNKANVDYNKQQLDLVKERARLGSASSVEVYQQEAQLAQVEVQYVQSQSDYQLAKANLVAYLATDIADDVVIKDASIPEEVDSTEAKRYETWKQTFDNTLSTALTRRPDYKSSVNLLDAADASVTMAKSGYYPQLTGSLSYGLSGNYPQFRTSNGEFYNFGNARSLSWGLTLSWSLFSGWQTDNSTQTAIVAKRNAEESLKDSRRRISLDVKTALLQLEFAWKTYVAAVKNFESQDKNLKVSQERYKVGSGTYLDLLFADNNQKQAQTTKINAAYQYLNAKSQMEYALGSVQY